MILKFLKILMLVKWKKLNLHHNNSILNKIEQIVNINFKEIKIRNKSLKNKLIEFLCILLIKGLLKILIKFLILLLIFLTFINKKKVLFYSKKIG